MRYLGIFTLVVLLLWGGLSLAVLGSNTLLGRRDIPKAIAFVPKEGKLSISFLGEDYRLTKTPPLGQLLGQYKRIRLELGSMEELIRLRKQWLQRIEGRIFPGNGE